MKVKELIAELQKYNAELPVCFLYGDDDDRWAPAVSVMETQPLVYDDQSEGDLLKEPESEGDEDDALNYIAIE